MIGKIVLAGAMSTALALGNTKCSEAPGPITYTIPATVTCATTWQTTIDIQLNNPTNAPYWFGKVHYTVDDMQGIPYHLSMKTGVVLQPGTHKDYVFGGPWNTKSVLGLAQDCSIDHAQIEKR